MKIQFLNLLKRKKSGGVMGSEMRPPMEKLTPDHPAVKAVRELGELCERLNRSYDAATSDGYNADMRGTYGSPNSEIITAQYTVAARVRTITKDTPHGKGFQRTMQNNVVGPNPFPLEMRVGKTDATGKFIEEKDTNTAIEDAWKDYCRQENFAIDKTWTFMEAMRMTEAELVGPGSVLCRLHRGYPHNEFKFAVDFLETDRLQATYQGVDKFGNPIRASISRDKKWKFPTFYHILTQHPGDFLGSFTYSPGLAGEKMYREMVPADDVIHFNNLRDRAEQEIGMTEMDATTQPLWRIHQYEKALTLTSIATATRPWWIEKDLPTGFVVPEALREQFANTPGLSGLDAGGGGKDPAQTQQGVGTPTTVLKPGAREEFPAGMKLKYADPKFPIEAAHEFRQDNIRDLAVGTGAAYQHLSGDFQNLGFIAGLMCMVPFQENCKVRQEHFKQALVHRLFREWLKSTILSGYFDTRSQTVLLTRLNEYCIAAHFKGKGFQFVNPLVQAQALILLCEAGHMTRQQVQDMLPDGMSFDKMVQYLKNEKEEMDAAGLLQDDVFVTRPSISKGNPGQTSPEPSSSDDAQPPDKSRPANPVRSRTRISPEMMALMESSMNGAH